MHYLRTGPTSTLFIVETQDFHFHCPEDRLTHTPTLTPTPSSDPPPRRRPHPVTIHRTPNQNPAQTGTSVSAVISHPRPGRASGPRRRPTTPPRRTVTVPLRPWVVVPPCLYFRVTPSSVHPVGSLRTRTHPPPTENNQTGALRVTSPQSSRVLRPPPPPPPVDLHVPSPYGDPSHPCPGISKADTHLSCPGTSLVSPLPHRPLPPPVTLSNPRCRVRTARRTHACPVVYHPHTHPPHTLREDYLGPDCPSWFSDTTPTHLWSSVPSGRPHTRPVRLRHTDHPFQEPTSPQRLVSTKGA